MIKIALLVELIFDLLYCSSEQCAALGQWWHSPECPENLCAFPRQRDAGDRPWNKCAAASIGWWSGVSPCQFQHQPGAVQWTGVAVSCKTSCSCMLEPLTFCYLNTCLVGRAGVECFLSDLQVPSHSMNITFHLLTVQNLQVLLWFIVIADLTFVLKIFICNLHNTKLCMSHKMPLVIPRLPLVPMCHSCDSHC